MKRETAREAAVGILSGGKVRQLEAAGLTVVWQDEWERLREFNRFWSKYWRYRGKPYNDLEEDGLVVVERQEWERLKRLEQSIEEETA